MAQQDFVRDAVRRSMKLAESLFHELRRRSADGPGVSREPYGPGEQAALDLFRIAAEDLALKIGTDAAGNLYMTLPGRDPSVPRWMVGSHMDSVPCGGNFDGAAGVVAGIAALAAFRTSGVTPARDICVMGIRAEEVSSWFGGSHDGHFGSRAALGLLPERELSAAIGTRSGKPIAEHIRAAGFDPAAIREGAPMIDARAMHGYLELHIEQGPVLENRGLPVGVVTAIRGAARARSARCVGEYTHSGAVPHEYRSDTVLATAELLHALDGAWTKVRAAGGDLVYTVGKLYTDAKLHSLTKVPGLLDFCIDFRSQSLDTLNEMAAHARALAHDIGVRRRVRFELGDFNIHLPALMDSEFQQRMRRGCEALGIAHMPIPSGAGHDAQDFAHAGVRSAMIFVRNRHGSHNPQEAMSIEDFEQGTRLLTWMLASE